MVEVLLRAADAGDTYLAWRWLDDLDHPGAQRLNTANVSAAIEVLDRALIIQRDGESEDDALRRAMVDGSFVTPDRELALASELAAAILPPALVDEITRKADNGIAVRVRLTPSPRLARVPWELLTVDESGRRLLDVADFVYDPPATVRTERSVTPDSWTDRATGPVIFVIDPRTHTSALKPILIADEAAADMFRERVDSYVRAGRARADYARRAVGGRVNRSTLHEWLLDATGSRLFYYGHVSALADEPGSASLHISDRESPSWGGLATPVGSHLPLSALDLLLGTTTAPNDNQRRYGSDEPLAGHQIWPMPPRVAVIACEGGADFRSSETFGLVIAMLNAGAELVTTTRWTMPTDRTFWQYYEPLELQKSRPTTDFALTVDAAHDDPDAVGVLTAWQRDQLELWRQHGDVAHTPLVWASLINTWAPASTTR